jgi:hypothetical protein
VAAGLLLNEGDRTQRYRFRHGLARAAIYNGIGRGRRASIHLRAGRALEERRATANVEAAQLAHHFIESDRSDVADEAIRYACEAAAWSRATHAYEDAAQHYRRAIEVLEHHRTHETEKRCAMLLELGEVCWQGGGPSARVIFEQAVAVARGLGGYSQFAEATLGLGGRFYAPTGADEPYIELLKEALQGVADDDSLYTRVTARLAEHLVFVDQSRAASLSRDAVLTARRLESPSLLASTLLSHHAALLHVAHHETRRRLATEQVEIARRCGRGELEALGLHWMLYDLLEAGDIVAAADARLRLQELAQELAQPLYRHSALVWQRVLAQIEGSFERAAQLAHEALNLAQGAHGEDAKAHFVAQQLTVVQDLGGAQRILPAVREQAQTGDALWLAAVRLLEHESAARQVRKTGGGALTSDGLRELPENVFWLTTLALLAELAGNTADERRAAVLYELLSPYASRFVQLTFNGSFGCLHRHLGLLAASLGHSRQASEHLEEAVRRHAEISAPALEARALCDYATALLSGRAAGSRRDATAMIEHALDLARGSGARKLCERLRRLTPAVALTHG